MAVALSPAAAIAACEAVAALIDAGSGPGYLVVYDGTIPQTGGKPDVTVAITTQNELARVPLKDPAFLVPAVSSGGNGTATINIDDPDAVLGLAFGVPTFARFEDSDNNEILQVGVSLASGDINCVPLSIDLGQSVDVGTVTYSHPQVL